MKFFALVLGLATATSALAVNLPLGKFDALAVKSKVKVTEEAPLFEGIVKLSNCSGSLIILEGMPTTAKALVLTNGHCLGLPGGFLRPGQVLVNQAHTRNMKVFDADMKLFNIKATKIVYATMTDTDATIYELDESYDQILAKANVRPLLLAPTHPQDNIRINIVSGYWDRNWACGVEGFVYRLLEGGWTWKDSIRYTEGCDTIGGTSGSPLVEDGTRVVIGINNTSNEDGERCTLNNPCEQDDAGRTVVLHQRSYGQQTYKFYGCFDATFKLDMSLATCELPKP